MKKNKILIITLMLGILFLFSYLYNSYATSTGLSLGNDENTYDILLNDITDTVEVPAKSSKTVYYQFSNTNKGTVKYHIGYTSNNVIAKVWWDTEDSVSGTIEYGEYKFIKLKLINDTTSDDTITIKPVLGYVNGGDVIPDSNTTLVTGTIKETNTLNQTKWIGGLLGISEIEELYFTNDNIVSENALGSANGNVDGSIKLWYTDVDEDDLYEVYIGSDNGITKLTSLRETFSGWTKLTKIDFKYVDTSSVQKMTHTFYRCSNLIELDLSSFDTSNVNDMQYMFGNCSKLEKINLSSFNTSNVKSMSAMFNGCSSLTSLDVTNFDTSIVENMSYMFSNCSKLTNINVSNFDTSNVTNMSYMFNSCSSLTNVDLHSFNTEKVTEMQYMFTNCIGLTSINLSDFRTPLLKYSHFMFAGIKNLKIVDLRNADLSGVTSHDRMFGEGTPTTVKIYLNDTQGNRDFMTNNLSSYTNVQYIPSA